MLISQDGRYLAPTSAVASVVQWLECGEQRVRQSPVDGFEPGPQRADLWTKPRWPVHRGPQRQSAWSPTRRYRWRVRPLRPLEGRVRTSMASSALQLLMKAW